MPRKNNKPYVRWDIRKARERASVSPVALPEPPMLTSGTCGSCGVSIPQGRRYCSRTCVSTANVKCNQAWERAMAERMEQSGWKLFNPTACCDRIGIRHGRVFFVEFKPIGSVELRSFQRVVHDLAPQMYRVVIGNYDPNNLGHLKIKGEGIGVPRQSFSRQKSPKSLASGATSRFKGVNFDKATGKWRARLRVNGVRISLGAFSTEEDAARAYDDELERIMGVRINHV